MYFRNHPSSDKLLLLHGKPTVRPPAKTFPHIQETLKQQPGKRKRWQLICTPHGKTINLQTNKYMHQNIMDITERFLNYTKFDTQSSEELLGRDRCL